MKEKFNIFSYIDYLVIFKKMIELNKKIYGYKAQLAEAAGCQRSYISQVLMGTVDLTAEHAVGLVNFWNFSEQEKEYFVTLVLFARAGSAQLKDFIRNKIDHLRRDQEDLSKRIIEKMILPEEQAAVFYSNWQYLAVTILLTIPQYRNHSAIAQRLNLKDETVQKVLRELQELGLATKVAQGWVATNNTIHIPRSSKFNSLNHSHWRNQAIQNAFIGDEQSVHYTSVCSISKSDAEKIKELVFHLIDESRRIVAPSREEELFCLTCDWFKV